MKKIIIASENPVKINAILQGFFSMFPHEQFEIQGISVASGVSHQPMSDLETYKGALQRAKNAQLKVTDAEYWVGIEGGIEKKDKEMEAFAWVIVLSRNTIGKGKTGTFYLPPPIIELIEQGKELGEADDIFFKRENSKQEGGSVGLLTHDKVTRTSYYTEAVIFALIPFRNAFLYESID